ncbi:hypothetical protein LTR62_002461 [Meristemomyces frigidus]|uniref:Uncharacterized protein n=1 Tax=Meristemomyces frigidus TaxID=1508187 RepID=A0AAN7TM78_9PEZI|nr:hypothetical protein LTR62_002461 [Meristemomyces frigidus]
MTSSYLSPDHPYLLTAGALLSCFPILLGIAVLLRPSLGLQIWHFTSPTTPKDTQLVLSLFRLFAIREFFLGTTILTCWVLGKPEVMGWLLLGVMPVVAVDGIVQTAQTGGGEWRHWGFVPVLVGLGMGLLGGWEGWM